VNVFEGNLAFVCHPYHRGGVTRWMVDMAIEAAKRGANVYFVTVEPETDFFSAGGRETMVALLENESKINLVKKRVNWLYEFGTEMYKTHVYADLLYENVPFQTPVILSDDFSIWRTSELLSGSFKFLGVLHSDEEKYYQLARKFESFIDAFICVSGRITKKLKEFNTDRNLVATIPCGIPLFDCLDAQKKEHDLLHLIYVGRISEYQKRVSDLLNICLKLTEHKIQYHLKIIGDGEDKKELIDKFVSAGLAEAVSFLGWLNKEQINFHLSNSDFLLLTSNFEGMPIAMMEALCCGSSVISTRVSGVEDYEDHPLSRNCLWINDIGDVKGAVENIVLAKSIPVNIRNQSAKQFARQEFSISGCYNRYIEVVSKFKDFTQPIAKKIYIEWRYYIF
jgi:glycosyltransferase involved in cell wall biosynthesis